MARTQSRRARPSATHTFGHLWHESKVAGPYPAQHIHSVAYGMNPKPPSRTRRNTYVWSPMAQTRSPRAIPGATSSVAKWHETKSLGHLQRNSQVLVRQTVGLTRCIDIAIQYGSVDHNELPLATKAEQCLIRPERLPPQTLNDDES